MPDCVYKLRQIEFKRAGHSGIHSHAGHKTWAERYHRKINSWLNGFGNLKVAVGRSTKLYACMPSRFTGRYVELSRGMMMRRMFCRTRFWKPGSRLKISVGMPSFRHGCIKSLWTRALLFWGKRENLSLDDEESHLVNLIEADEWIDGDDLALQLRKAVASLPEKQRMVFNMKYFDELKYEQMSEILGTSVGALKASYHLAVKKIEKYFGETDWKTAVNSLLPVRDCLKIFWKKF